MDAGVVRELAGSTVPEHGLTTRLGVLLSDIAGHIGGTVPMC